MEKLTNVYQLTQEKEKLSLEEEIEQLESLLYQRKKKLNKNMEIKNTIDNPLSTVNDFKDKCECIKKQIELTTKLTGIVINELQYEPLKAENLIHYSLTGLCRKIRFRVEFDCLQHDNEDNIMTIVKLDTYLPEYATNEMNEHFVRISGEKSLWGFFQLLSLYSEWEVYRITIFEHFMGKYSQLVELVKGNDAISYLMIHNKSLSYSPVFCVTWIFDVDHACKAKPRLTLSAKVPDYISKEDKVDRILDSGARFKDMVEELGIEHAIDNLVRTLLLS